MSLIFLRFLVFVLLAIGSTGERVQAQSHRSDDPNQLVAEAARIWREVYASWDDELLYLDGSPERFDPAVAAREYGRLQPAIDAMHRAARLGLPVASPPATPWPLGPISSELQDLRDGARLIMNDARWRVHSGQTSDLGERCAVLFDMAANTSNGGDFIQSLIGMAVGSASLNILREQAIPSGSLTSEQAKVALAALEKATADDGLQFSSSLARTADRDLAWITDQNADPASREAMLAQMAETATNKGNMELAAQFGVMSPDEIATAAQQHAALLDRMSAITAMRDLDAAKVAWTQLEKEREAGIYGPFAEVMTDDGNVVAIIEHWEKSTAEVRADLETIARDPNGAKRLMNAAYFYQRAIGAWQRLPGQFRQPLLDAVIADIPADDGEDAPTPPEQWHKRLTEVFADLDRAAMIEQCAFQPIEQRQLQTNWQWPGEVIPLGELAAVRRFALREALKSDDATPRDTARLDALGLLTMIDHLAQEGVIEFTLSAADMLAALAELESWPTIDGAPDDVAARWSELRERFERDDPLRLERTARLLPTLTVGPLLRSPDRSATTENLLRIDTFRSRLPFTVFTHGMGTGLLARDAQALRAEAVAPALRAARERLEKIISELLDTQTTDQVLYRRARFETAMTAEDHPALAEWSRCWTLPLFDLFERRETIRELARKVAERVK